jgi:hypothetical protein
MTRRGLLAGASRDAETVQPPTSRRLRIGQPASIRGFVARDIVVSTALDPFLSIRALAKYSSLSPRTLRTYLDLPP